MLPINDQLISESMVRALIGHFPNPAVTSVPRYMAVAKNFTGTPAGFTTIGDITKAVEPGATLTADEGDPTTTQAQITTTCSISLRQRRLDELGFSFNPSRHLLQMWWDFYSPRGTLIASWPQGLFRFRINSTRALQMSGPVWSLSGFGVESYVDDMRFKSPYTIKAGTDFGGAMIRMALNPMILGTTPTGLPCAGPGWPAALTSIPNAGLTLPADMTTDWTQDTQLGAMSRLAKTGLLWPPWGTATGVLKTAKSPLYRNGTPSASYVLTTNDESIIIGAVTQEFGGDFANRVQVQGTSSATIPIIATAENHSLDSLISFENYGSWVDAPGVTDSSIPDQATAQATADLLLQAKNEVQDIILVTTTPIPFLELHDFVGVFVTNADGTKSYIDSSAYPFEVGGWTLNVDQRQCQWRLMQTVPT